MRRAEAMGPHLESEAPSKFRAKRQAAQGTKKKLVKKERKLRRLERSAARQQPHEAMLVGGPAD